MTIDYSKYPEAIEYEKRVYLNRISEQRKILHENVAAIKYEYKSPDYYIEKKKILSTYYTNCRSIIGNPFATEIELQKNLFDLVDNVIQFKISEYESTAQIEKDIESSNKVNVKDQSVENKPNIQNIPDNLSLQNPIMQFKKQTPSPVLDLIGSFIVLVLMIISGIVTLRIVLWRLNNGW